jgi:hypothetical protein
MLKPYTLPPPAMQGCRTPHSPLPYREAAAMAAQQKGESMETVKPVLVFIHLLGMAAIVGGYFAGLSNSPKRLTAGITHGTLLQFLTGLLLIGIAEAEMANETGDDLRHVRFGIKISVAAVILLLAWPRRKDVSIASNTYHAIGVLALLNVAVAVFVK